MKVVMNRRSRIFLVMYWLNQFKFPLIICFFTLSVECLGQQTTPTSEYDLPVSLTEISSNVDFYQPVRIKISTHKGFSLGPRALCYESANPKKCVPGRVFNISETLWRLELTDLKPHRQYTVLIPADGSGLHHVNLELVLNSAPLGPRHRFRKTFVSSDDSIAITKSELLKDYATYESDFLNGLGIVNSIFSNYQDIINTLNPLVHATNLQTLYSNVDISDLGDFIDELDSIQSFLSSQGSGAFIETSAYIASLMYLEKNLLLPQLFSGVITADFRGIPSIDLYYQPQTKISNNRRELIRNLKMIWTLAHNSEIPFANPRSTSLNNIDVAMHNILKLFESLDAKYRAIEKKLNESNLGFSISRRFVLSTQSSKFSEYLSDIVKPDLGFMIFGGEERSVLNESLLTNIRPYFGVEIGLPSPDNFPLFWNSNLRRRFFLQLGVTLGSIEREGVREDLFGKSNIITGLGIRINRAFYIGGGVIFYRHTNANTLIDNPSFAHGFYGSIGVHSNFQNLLNPFTGQIFK